jgi:nitroreductase
MDLIQVINDRRSIRKYRPDPVPDEILLQILEAARQSPSWANTQAPRFVVVKDQATKEALAGTFSEHNPGRHTLIEAPVAVCLFGKNESSGYFGGNAATAKGDWLLFDAGIFMEHFVLAAWNFGLGTVHMGLFDHAAVKKILDIPDGYEVVELSPLGYFDTMPAAKPRRPLEETVHLNKFGQPYKH